MNVLHAARAALLIAVLTAAATVAWGTTPLTDDEMVVLRGAVEYNQACGMWPCCTEENECGVTGGAAGGGPPPVYCRKIVCHVTPYCVGAPGFACVDLNPEVVDPVPCYDLFGGEWKQLDPEHPFVWTCVCSQTVTEYNDKPACTTLVMPCE